MGLTVVCLFLICIFLTASAYVFVIFVLFAYSVSFFVCPAYVIFLFTCRVSLLVSAGIWLFHKDWFRWFWFFWFLVPRCWSSECPASLLQYEQYSVWVHSVFRCPYLLHLLHMVLSLANSRPVGALGVMYLMLLAAFSVIIVGVLVWLVCVKF